MLGSSILYRIALAGHEEVKRILSEVGVAGEQSGKKIGEGVRGATPHLREVSEGVDRLREAFGHFTDLIPEAEGGFGRLKEALGDLRGTIGIVGSAIIGAVGSFAALAESAGSHAAELEHASQRAGTSVENYQTLNYILRQTGASGEAFERAVRQIANATKSLSEESAKAQEKLAEAQESYNDRVQRARQEYDEGQERSRVTNQLNVQSQLAMAQFEYQETLRNINLHVTARDKQTAADQRAADQYVEAQRKIVARNQLSAQSQIEAFTAQQRLNRELQQAQHDYERATEKINRNSDAATGGAAAWKRFGIELADAGGKMRDPLEIFFDAAEKIGAMRTQAERTQAAIALFGARFGGQLVEALSKGRDGLQELAKEADRLGIVLDHTSTSTGKKFEESMNMLGMTARAAKDRIGLAVAPLFTELNEALAEAIGGMSKPMAEATKALAEAVEPVFADIVAALKGDNEQIQSQFILLMVQGFRALGTVITTVGGVIRDVLSVIMHSFQELADLYNELWGSKLKAGDILAFIVALRGLVTVLGLVRGAFLLLNAAAGPWGLLLTGILIAVVELVKHFDELKKAAIEAGEAISKWLGLSGGNAQAPSGGGGSSSSAPSSPDTGSAPPLQLATGGLVHGPGSDTSDSVPALLSRGEYVVHAAATRMFLPFLEAINNGFAGLARPPALGPLGGGPLRYASGGAVLRPSPASFGGVPMFYNRVGIDLMFGPHKFGLDTDAQTAQRLIAYARGKKLLNAGKKQSWSSE